MLSVVGAYMFMMYQSIDAAANNMYVEIDREFSPKRQVQISIEEKQPFSVLVLGVDERSGDRGRSDTMIVITVNPNLESIQMLSIPRDTYVNIPGRGMDKINHAYAFGDIELSIETVEDMFDIPIDYFAKVNMEGFEEVVDAVGGVTIQNDLVFEYSGITYPAGEIRLETGEEAMGYARMRYEDPRGDFGRQERQRKIVQGIIKEAAAVESLWNFDDIISALGSNLQTNFEFTNLIDFQRDYRPALNTIENSSLDSGSGEYINDIYYYVVPEASIVEWSERFKTHLEL